MKRDKDSTKQKLIDATGRVILRDGFKGIGINSIAKEAGVDKVLIYRYFNDLDGLLKEYVTQKDYYSSLPVNIPDNIDDTLKFANDIFLGQLRTIIENKELQEILLWELSSTSEVATVIAAKREKSGVELLKKINKIISFKNNDIPAHTAIIIGGVYYLALRSRTATMFNGIDLSNPKGWKRIEKSISYLVNLLTTVDKNS